MSDNQELERVQAREGARHKIDKFIIEAQKLRDKREFHDATIATITNVQELVDEDLDMWIDYEKLLKEVYESLDSLDFSKEIPVESLEHLQKLKEQTMEFVISAKQTAVDLAGEDEENRRKFVPWMTNRLNALVSIFDVIKINGDTNMKLLKTFKDDVLQEDYNRFVKTQ